MPTTIPPTVQAFIAAGERYKTAQLAHEAAPSPETEEVLQFAARAVLRAAESLPTPAAKE